MRILCVAWMLAALAPGAVADPYSDVSVKAAFVLRFAGYVEWPPGAVPERTLTIAVLGSDELADNLRQLAADRSLLGRAVEVRRIGAVEQARGAQILYVDSRQLRRLRAARNALSQQPVLIVSDAGQGLAAGSMINFLTADSRVRFEVALGTARRAGLGIGPELLSLAARVTE